jgi:hypothetical protein
MFTTILEKVERLERENAELKSRIDKLGSDEGTVSRLSKPLEDEPQSYAKLGMSTSEIIKMTITEVESDSHIAKVESIIPLDKGRCYWYQKHKTDIPEYVKILEVHKEGNDYYYTIRMRDKSERQTIGQYLFHWKKPPLYSLLPNENRERIERAFDYGSVLEQINAWDKAKMDEHMKKQTTSKRDETFPLPETPEEWLEYFNRPRDKVNMDPRSSKTSNENCNQS